MDTVLRNPVYFLFLILGMAGAYVTYTLNLWGPMLKMTNAATQQALVEGKKRLREFLEENPRAAHVIAEATGHEEYEMKSSRSSARRKIKTDRAADEDEDEI